MARAGLDPESVVTAAARLADAEGLEAVTLARLAGDLGVRAPSLYAHVDGLGDLRRRLAARGARELGDELREAAAGRAGTDALQAVAEAYRSYAHRHPGAYAAVQSARATTGGQAAEQLVGVVLAVLRGYGLGGDDAVHAARVLRAALHGFVSLEAEGGFGIPLPLDESFTLLVEVLDTGLGAIGGRATTASGG
jgi:AcrR family transcriptional regulator